jgi:PAS domain S-box-containing protein
MKKEVSSNSSPGNSGLNPDAISLVKPDAEEFRAAFRDNPLAMMLVDGSGRIIECSASARQLFDSDASHILDTPIQNIAALSTEDRASLNHLITKLQNSGITEEGQLSVKNKQGAYQNIHVTATRLSKEHQLFMFLFTYRDIAVQMNIEKELRDRERHYKELLESSPYAIMIVDRMGIVIDCNEQVQIVLKKGKNKIVGERLDLLVLPFIKEKRLCISQFIRALRKQSGDPFRISMNVGENNTYLTEVHLTLLEKNGNPYAVQILCRDITKSQKLEATLKRVAQQWTTTFDAIHDGVCLLDMSRKILRCNKAFAELVNKEFKDIVGYQCHDILDCSPVRNEKCPIDKMLATKERITCSATYHKTRWLSVTANPIYDDERNLHGTVLVVIDTTNQRKLEEELLKTQKLESIGIMAGGIAHDFNNILCSILGNLEILKLYSSPNDKTYARLSKIDKATIRARDLVQQLLTFSKGGAPVRKTASIVDVVIDTSEFVLRGSNINCLFHMTDKIWPVEVDVNQISQVINNMILNAIQAMPQGGTIDITFRNYVTQADDGLPVEPGRYVKIDVEDSGCGIPDEYIGKIFDPYFTTKSKGTGLGLATSYSIVKRHEGYITASSTKHKGATFTIYLRASDKPLRSEDGRATTLCKGSGRILVMDDEQPILDMLKEMLELCGYEAVTALEGAQAIDIYTREQNAQRGFDAVIVDLTVPGGMGGQETLRRLRLVNPHVKVIVSSGYSNDPILANFQTYRFNGAISKPFKIKEMSAIVADVIFEHKDSKFRGE